ncbi:hypothetical protein Ciccas_000994 [Cichlidogyrus casuarinus]|uniref:Uncharacterized protein n=1 Tax=Cichlidogyrus casuarinus TaxID=1844966 RepID=A0ABD2QLB0_9PLAT
MKLAGLTEQIDETFEEEKPREPVPKQSIATIAKQLIQSRHSVAQLSDPVAYCFNCEEYIVRIKKLQAENNELESDLNEQKDLVENLQFQLEELNFEKSQHYSDTPEKETVIRVANTDFVLPAKAKTPIGKFFGPLQVPSGTSTPQTVVKNSVLKDEKENLTPDQQKALKQEGFDGLNISYDQMHLLENRLASYQTLVSTLKSQLDVEQEEKRLLQSRLLDQAAFLQPKSGSNSPENPLLPKDHQFEEPIIIKSRRMLRSTVKRKSQMH